MDDISIFNGSVSLRMLILKYKVMVLIGISPALFVMALGDLSFEINIMIGLVLIAIFAFIGVYASKFDIKIKDDIVCVPSEVTWSNNLNAYFYFESNKQGFGFRFNKGNIKRAYPMFDKNMMRQLNKNNKYEVSYMRDDKDVVCIEFNKPLEYVPVAHFLKKDDAPKIEKIYVSVKKPGELVSELNKSKTPT